MLIHTLRCRHTTLLPCYGFLTMVRISYILQSLHGYYCRYCYNVVLVKMFTLGSISFRRHVLLFVNLLSRSKIHRHPEIWIGQVSTSVSPLFQGKCHYLSKSALTLFKMQWSVQSFRELLALSHNFRIIAVRFMCLELVTFANFYQYLFTLISLWMPLSLFFISLVFSVLISTLYRMQIFN